MAPTIMIATTMATIHFIFFFPVFCWFTYSLHSPRLRNADGRDHHTVLQHLCIESGCSIPRVNFVQRGYSEDFRGQESTALAHPPLPSERYSTRMSHVL